MSNVALETAAVDQLLEVPAVAEMIAYDLHHQYLGGPSAAPTDDMSWLMYIGAVGHMEGNETVRDIISSVLSR